MRFGRRKDREREPKPVKVAWARNLADTAYDKRVFFFGNEEPDYPPRRYTSRADPRQAGVTLSRLF